MAIDDDSSLEETESYLFHEKLLQIAVIAFAQFINAIPDDYSKKEKIKEIIKVIKDDLVYKTWEMNYFGTQIMKIPNHLPPHCDDKDSKWALDAWNKLISTTQHMNNYIKENLNIENDTNSIDEDSEGGSE